MRVIQKDVPPPPLPMDMSELFIEQRAGQLVRESAQCLRKGGRGADQRAGRGAEGV